MRRYEGWTAPRQRVTLQNVMDRNGDGTLDLIDGLVTIAHPKAGLSAVLFNVPHSGRCYPADFLARTRLDAFEIRASEDKDVDLLFGDAVLRGGSLLTARFPRAYLDVNREPFELDPQMFTGTLPAQANTRSLRVANGLGTIPRTVGEGREIYRGRLPVSDAISRITGIYQPYHALLAEPLATARRCHGIAVLVDCHSMPSAAVARTDQAHCDIVLGDRFGTSAAGELVERVQDMFHAMGYRVSRNRPYAGGFITETYGVPSSDVHALQIEINRALYMNERTLEPGPGFEALRSDLGCLIDGIVQWTEASISDQRLAAE